MSVLLYLNPWFGYRPKYTDLCRIYLTQVSIDQFDAVLSATEDLKAQFSEMRLRDKKPIDFGIMIKECPDILETSLLITSRNKMYGTQLFERRLNYSGVYADTSKLYKEPIRNKHNLDVFAAFCKNITFDWKSKEESSLSHKYYMAQNVSQHYIAQLFRDIQIPIENKKFNTDGLAEYIEESDKFPYWDVVIANGDSKGTPFMGIKPVIRSFHMKSENDLIRIGGSNNRVLDPGLLNAGLWYRDGETLSAKEYCNHRAVPILVVFPIDLNCENDKDDKNTRKWKTDVKEELAGNVLLAFAYGFPGIDSKIMVTYRANAVMIGQLTKGIELDDEGEGVDDTDD